MNPLLLQFIGEARELLEKTGQGLLTLENNPGNGPVINDVFRALHTLKGSSGLFEPEYSAITRLAHAGEDLLDEVRKEKLTFTSTIADLLLESLDHIGQWLDVIEESQKLPEEAAAASAELAVRLRRLMGEEPPTEQAAPTAEAAPAPTTAEWLEDFPPEMRLLALQQATAAAWSQLVAVIYDPDPNCFFFGEDPLYQVRQTPGLVALQIVTPSPWPAPAEWDPFVCQLAFRLLSSAPVADLEEFFRYIKNQIQLIALAPAQLLPEEFPRKAETDFTLLRDVLQTQAHILNLPCQPEERSSRLAAVGQVLRYCITPSHKENLPVLEEALCQAEMVHSFESVRRLVQTLLAEIAPVAKPAPEHVPEKSAAAPLAAASPAASAAAPPPMAETTAKSPQEPAQSKVLKIPQERIDHLMDLIGELVVAKNSMPYLAQRAEKEFGTRRLGREIQEYYGVINRLTEEMQSAVMQVRMMPVDNIFQRFPRLVRDIARKLDKKIRLVMEGGETEADKNVVEAMADPLIHLLRNSLDHGIESPEERIQAGKEAEGEIRLSAFQESDRVIIEIRDDGKGIDPERIRQKALAKGMMEATALAALSDQETIQLIFMPGFSTAEQVSDLSGRGVGMDVVRTTVNNLNGSITLTSTKGAGSCVRMELPMTMAVTRVMLVEEGGALYGIPLDRVVETVLLPPTAIQQVKEQEATVLRDQILPIFRLRHLLRLTGTPALAKREEEAMLVVRPADGEIGLIVEEFHKGVDIVLKPLEGILAGLPGYAGAALLGNGRVLLVLNLRELIHAH